MKSAYVLVPLDALQDQLLLTQAGVKLEAVAVEENGYVRLVLSGDTLPNEHSGERVRLRYTRAPEAYALKTSLEIASLPSV